MAYVISFILAVLVLISEVILQSESSKNYAPCVVLSSKVVKYLAIAVLIVMTIWQFFTLR